MNVINEYNIYQDFLGKKVTIGIPHYHRAHRLFWITGLAQNVDEDFMTLLVKNGLKKIRLDSIIEISIENTDVNGGRP